MNNINQPAFRPNSAATVNLNAGVASANVQVQTGNFSRHVRVFNSGANTAFVEFGTSNAVAASTTTSMPVAAGTVEIFSCPEPWVAAITGSGTALLYFTPGEGM